MRRVENEQMDSMDGSNRGHGYEQIRGKTENILKERLKFDVKSVKGHKLWLCKREVGRKQ